MMASAILAGGGIVVASSSSSRGNSVGASPALPLMRPRRLATRWRPITAAANPNGGAVGGNSSSGGDPASQDAAAAPRRPSGVGGAEAAAVGGGGGKGGDQGQAAPARASSSTSSRRDDGGKDRARSGGSGGSGRRRRSASLLPPAGPSSSSSAPKTPPPLLHPLRVAINVAFFFAIVRLWPYSGRATNLMAPSAVAAGATTAEQQQPASALASASASSPGRTAAAGAAAPAAAAPKRSSTPPMVIVSVPFSEFSRRLKADEVAAVTVDRGAARDSGAGSGGVVGVAFTLRPAALERLTRGFDSAADGDAASPSSSSSSADPYGIPPALQRQLQKQKQQREREQHQQHSSSSLLSSSSAAATASLASTPPSVRVTFRTVRPPDYALPYDLLERNGVTFAAGGGGGGGGAGEALSTALVWGVYAALLLSALGRLPAFRGSNGGGVGGGGIGSGPGGGGGGGLGGAGSAAARGAGRRHGAAPQGRAQQGQSPLAALTGALQRRLFGNGGRDGGSASSPSRGGNNGPGASAGTGAAAVAAADGTAPPSPPAVTFADVAGVDEAKEELQEVVDFLRAPARFARLGARPPSGVLLCGPPGTGKTLLARAVAGEAGVPFFSIAASEFIELYVGLGALRVRELFAAARREAPCILFIDEIDAVAKGRGDSRRLSAGNDEREQTLNPLLTEMDGFETGMQQASAARAAAARRRELQDRRRARGRRARRRRLAAAAVGASEAAGAAPQQQRSPAAQGAGGAEAAAAAKADASYSSDDDDGDDEPNADLDDSDSGGEDDDGLDDDDDEDEESEDAAEAALMAEADASAAAEAAAAGVVIVLAATNRPDVLDPALLRPGRFDRRVSVERPDRVGREQILRSHIERRALPLARDVSPSKLAAGTTGFTGADLANLVNEAALLAGRKGLRAVRAEEFDAALMRSVAGIEKKRSVLSGSEKRTVALHEAGHAVVGAAVAALLPGVAAAAERLSIVPRSGGALGFAYTPQKADDRALMYDCEVRSQLALLMGGRAAEALFSPAISTGASDDIRRATELAVRAVSEFGLSSAVGPVHVALLGQGGGGGDDGGLPFWAGGGGGAGAGRGGGDSAASRAEREAGRLLRGALAVAADTLRRNAGLHASLAALLEERERLDGADLAAALAGAVAPPSLRAFVLEAETPSDEAAAAALVPLAGAGNPNDLAL